LTVSTPQLKNADASEGLQEHNGCTTAAPRPAVHTRRIGWATRAPGQMKRGFGELRGPPLSALFEKRTSDWETSRSRSSPNWASASSDSQSALKREPGVSARAVRSCCSAGKTTPTRDYQWTTRHHFGAKCVKPNGSHCLRVMSATRQIHHFETASKRYCCCRCSSSGAPSKIEVLLEVFLSTTVPSPRTVIKTAFTSTDCVAMTCPSL
jgi:hypothetical protein